MNKTILQNGVIVEDVADLCFSMVKKIAKRYDIVYCIEGTDLESYLNERIVNILTKYNPSKMTLHGYLSVALKQRGQDFIRTNRALNGVLRFSEIDDHRSKTNKDPEGLEPFEGADSIDIQSDYERSESKQRVISHLFSVADDMQRAILTAYLDDDLNANQIAEKLGVYPLKVYRSLERLAKKCNDDIRKEALELIA